MNALLIHVKILGPVQTASTHFLVLVTWTIMELDAKTVCIIPYVSWHISEQENDFVFNQKNHTKETKSQIL